MDDLLGFCLDTAVIGSALDEVAGSVATGLGIGGTIYVECYDQDGRLKWAFPCKNIVPDAVINDVLGVYYGAATPTTIWYLGMVDNAGFAAFAAADTMASHPGWTENTNCTQTTRPVWTPGAPAAKAIQNTTQVTLNLNATVSIRGFFLASANVLGGVTGKLAATALIPTGPQPGNSGDILKVTYVINGTTT